VVQPSSLLDSFSSDGFPPFKNGLSATELHVVRSERLC
jgi:hypothetical protein